MSGLKFDLIFSFSFLTSKKYNNIARSQQYQIIDTSTDTEKETTFQRKFFNKSQVTVFLITWIEFNNLIIRKLLFFVNNAHIHTHVYIYGCLHIGLVKLLLSKGQLSICSIFFTIKEDINHHNFYWTMTLVLYMIMLRSKEKRQVTYICNFVFFFS